MKDLQKPLQSAVFLLKQLSEKTISPQQLSTHQRRICVRFMLQERKHSSHEMAAILQIHSVTVRRYTQQILEQNSWMLDDIDERKIAVDIIQSADVACARLFRKGREKDAFTIKKDAIELLQSLGYLKRKPIEVEANLTLLEIIKLAHANTETNQETFDSGNGRGVEKLLTT